MYVTASPQGTCWAVTRLHNLSFHTFAPIVKCHRVIFEPAAMQQQKVVVCCVLGRYDTAPVHAVIHHSSGMCCLAGSYCVCSGHTHVAGHHVQQLLAGRMQVLLLLLLLCLKVYPDWLLGWQPFVSVHIHSRQPLGQLQLSREFTVRQGRAAAVPCRTVNFLSKASESRTQSVTEQEDSRCALKLLCCRGRQHRSLERAGRTLFRTYFNLCNSR